MEIRVNDQYQPVSLKNLANVPASAIIYHVAKHLFTQNKRAYSTAHSGCRYKHNELKCAAGCLIADDEYNSELEGHGWAYLVKTAKVPSEHQMLINALQKVHDNCAPATWPNVLLGVAYSFGCAGYVIDDAIEAARVSRSLMGEA